MASPGRMRKSDKCTLINDQGERYQMIVEHAEIRTDPRSLHPRGIPEKVVLWLNHDAESIGEQRFYVLDSREVVGNCGLFWRPDSAGYTCDLDDSGLYTKTQVDVMRPTDIPVPKELAEKLAIRHVRWDQLRREGIQFGGGSRVKSAERRRELEDKLKESDRQLHEARGEIRAMHRMVNSQALEIDELRESLRLANMNEGGTNG